jgi:hypothetical protein
MTKFAAVFLALTLLLVPVAACNGDAPPPTTPPPTTAPTPTPTAEPTPTPEPTKEPPPLPDSIKYDAQIFGETVAIETGMNGALWDVIEATSPDGAIKISMAWGLTLQDKDEVPIEELSITLNEDAAQPEDGSILLGSTVTFMPDSTTLNPALTFEYDYSAFADQIAAIPDVEVYLAQYIHGNGNWAKLYTDLDTDANIAQTKIDQFAKEHTIGLIAAPPPPEVVDPDAPTNGVDIKIEYISTINAAEPAQLIVKTEPNAWVLTWWVLPVTGTRTTRPLDRWRQADADGKIVWDFELSKRTSKGDGRMEFYVTTSTDEEFLKYVEAGRLDVPYPDLTSQLKDLKNGKIAQIVVDDNTTIKMIPFNVAKGL